MKYNWSQLFNCAATKAIQDIKPLPDKTTISAIRKKTEIRCKAPGKAEISNYCNLLFDNPSLHAKLKFLYF